MSLRRYFFWEPQASFVLLRKALVCACSLSLALSSASCSLLGLEDDEEDDTALFAALALVALNSSACTGGADTTTTTIDLNSAALGADGCVSGVNTSMDSGLPSWIRNKFTCQVAYVSGGNYCFKSKNLPNNGSMYYPAGAALNAAVPGGKTKNPNDIATQTISLTIPASPMPNTGTLTSTQGGQASIGITVNGLAIFNNAAAPGDTLANEVTSFDGFDGHPENTGTYHHHAAVPKASNNDANLIGIALDGYAVYGLQCDNGTAATGDDFTPSDLDSLHGHTTVKNDFSTATYHYHFANDATAGIQTLMGSYFYGVAGSSTK